MKAKVQVVIESEHGQFIVHDVATITRSTLSAGTLGLTLAEGKNLLQNLQSSIVITNVTEQHYYRLDDSPYAAGD